jgi:hypothetical protein
MLCIIHSLSNSAKSRRPRGCGGAGVPRVRETDNVSMMGFGGKGHEARSRSTLAGP